MKTDTKYKMKSHAKTDTRADAKATAKGDAMSAYITRDAILALLSDVEVASVSTAEAAPGLAAGDEFIDLVHLDKGVRRAGKPAVPMGEVLPRKAVRAATWSAIVKQLAPSGP